MPHGTVRPVATTSGRVKSNPPACWAETGAVVVTITAARAAPANTAAALARTGRFRMAEFSNTDICIVQ